MSKLFLPAESKQKSFFIRLVSFFIAILLLALLSLQTSTDSIKAKASATEFTFKNGMSENVLRSYASRAVTFQELCGGASYVNPIIEEDIRMLLRTGTKFVGRAAMFAWSGTSKDAIEKHFYDAKEKAKMVHDADPEIILQAGIFEIVRLSYTEKFAIPDWVFKAFDQKVETRNFNYSLITQDKPDFWGAGTGLPDITSLETQMWFYYWGCRYIDIGFESIHLGQAELMAGNKQVNYKYWEKVNNLLRSYGKKNARRGVVLVDAHSSVSSGGMKIGGRLILDIQAACVVPAETVKEDGILKCKIGHYQEPDCDYQWIGRTSGGAHPLGFDIETNITILEFDNHGRSGNKEQVTRNAHYCWGYDDITWFAMQPESYRNEFLLYCDNYLKTTKKILNAKGQQVYFLQPPMRRVISPYAPDFPVTKYKIGNYFNSDFMLDYLSSDEYSWNYGKVNILSTIDENNYSIENTMIYRANRNSDGCPNGFGQEDTIRQIFLGKDAPENPEYQRIVLPATYGGGEVTSGTTTQPTEASDTTTTAASSSDQTKSESRTTPPLNDKSNSTWFILLATGFVVLIGCSGIVVYFSHYKNKSLKSIAKANLSTGENLEKPEEPNDDSASEE